MRGSVDAGGQAAGDGKAVAGQCGGEFARNVAATRGGVAAADDGDRRLPEQGRFTGDEQCDRRVGAVAQQRRIVGLAPADQVVVVVLQPGSGPGLGIGVRA